MKLRFPSSAFHFWHMHVSHCYRVKKYPTFSSKCWLCYELKVTCFWESRSKGFSSVSFMSFFNAQCRTVFSRAWTHVILCIWYENVICLYEEKGKKVANFPKTKFHSHKKPKMCACKGISQATSMVMASERRWT